MSIRLNFTVNSIQSNQSLIDDSVSYSLCGKMLGQNIVVPVNTGVIRKLDAMLQGEDINRPVEPEVVVPEVITQASPSGYEFGIMYGEEDE